MKNVLFLLGVVFLIHTAATYAADSSSSSERPNVILFLVDDMGWMDSTPYGSKYYETPNMERLAKRALRFTQAYAQPLCSPTRASILTGQSAARHRITAPACHKLPRQSPGAPISSTYLEPDQYTLAEALRDAGYKTGHFGKWHLGLTEPHWPEAQGFDVAWHAHPDAGPPSYFSPYNVVPPGSPKKGAKGGKTFIGSITDGPPGEYITDRLTDEALKFIRAHQGRPFFLNLWHYGVHGPFGHKESYTQAFVKKEDPSGRQGNPIMASMLKSVDESLGRVLDELDTLGLSQNTLIIFASDNGGNVHGYSDDESDSDLSDIEAARLADWRKWAGDQPPTSNQPLRDGKGSLYEGGIRVPLMMSWPGHISSGATTDAIVHSYDYYPTVLDLLQIPHPAGQVFDGISIVPVLKDPSTQTEGPIFIDAQSGCGLRLGDWKLLRRYHDSTAFELYNLRDDSGETKDISAMFPDKVSELKTLLHQHFTATGGLPRRLRKESW